MMTLNIVDYNRLKKDSNVLSVSLDQEVELAESELKEISIQELELQRSLGEYDWNNDMIKGFDAWDDGYTGKGIDVAVFDTGFASHPDISYAGGHSVFEDESWSVDHNGHGTHVAGIIGANKGTFMQGISPDANIYGVKVFGEQNGREHFGSVQENGEFVVSLNRKLESGEKLTIYHEDGQNKSDELTFRVHHDGAYDYQLNQISQTNTGTLGNVSNLRVTNGGQSIHGEIDGDFKAFNTIVVQDNHTYNTAPLSKVILGLDWAIQNDMDIVNMSIGSHNYSPEFDLLIKIALMNEILVVASSGNDGNPMGTGDTVTYPGKYEGAIAVSAVDRDMNRALFSGTGSANELSAPGVDIGGLGTNNDYVLMRGTSQAAPHVTGMAAILMEKYPDYSVTEIRNLLTQNAMDLGPEGRDAHFGYGLVQYDSGELEVEAPIIEYDGKTEIEIEYGSEFEFPTVTVLHESEDIEADLRVTDEKGKEVSVEEFSTEKDGTYTLTYSAEDSYGNEAEELVITLVVLPYVDTEAPVIKYDGDERLEIEYGQKFEVPEVKVTDNVDEDLKATITIHDSDDSIVKAKDIDTTIPATYTVTYEAEDKAGNKAEPVIITIEVLPYEDTTPPVIHYDGEKELEISYGKPFVLPTVTVTDDFDKNVEIETTIKDKNGKNVNLDDIDTTVPATYTVTFEAVDEAGNEAEPVVITIKVLEYVDTIPPVLHYDGEKEIEVEYGSKFDMPKVTATDNFDKDVKPELTITNEKGKEVSFDTKNLGTYTFTYSATDKAGNEADEIIITVEVVDTTPPVIEYNGELNLEVSYGSSFEIPTVNVTDNADKDLKATLVIKDENDKVVKAKDFDTKEINTYTFTYSTKDHSGNKADDLVITVAVVDTEAPVIDYDGDEVIAIEYGEDFAIPTVKVTDNVDKNVKATATIHDEDGNVVKIKDIDTTIPATYTVTHEAVDKAGNKAEPVIVTMKVRPYIDTTPPVIHYDGEKELTIEHGEDFVLPTATATDDFDLDVDVVTTIHDEDGKVVELDEIDTTTPAMYTVTFEAKDQAGNKAEKITITIEVLEYVDTVAPVIEYDGDLEIEVVYGSSFDIPTVKVTDNVDEDLEATLVITNENGDVVKEKDFNTKTSGTYTFTYSAKDNSGNKADDLLITVIVGDFVDTEPPVINYNGKTSFTVKYDGTFTVPTLTATDNVDGKIDTVLTITNPNGDVVGELDTTVAGTHTLTYVAEDSAGNKTELAMHVTVEDYVDTVAPVIEYNGDDPIVLEFGSEFTVPSVKVTDNYDSNPIYTHELKDEAGNVISNIDTTVVGNYSLIYTATDASGNTTQKTIAITVKEEVSEETLTQINNLFAMAKDELSVSHLDAAMKLIQELPDGEEKEALINENNELKYGTTSPTENQIPIWTKNEINTLLNGIESDLKNAEGSLDLVEELLNDLPESEEKSSLFTRYETLRDDYEAILEEDDARTVDDYYGEDNDENNDELDEDNNESEDSDKDNENDNSDEDESNNEDEESNEDENNNKDEENNGSNDDENENNDKDNEQPGREEEDSGDNKVNVVPENSHSNQSDEKQEKLTGEKLPKTSTNMYLWMTIGTILIFIGSVLIKIRKLSFRRN